MGFRQGDAAGTGFPATSSDWRCSAHPGHPRTVLDNSTTGNTLWADTCTGLRSFHIIWDGPKGRARGADEWAAHINTSGGAGVVTHGFRPSPGERDYYEMYGTVNFEGNGSLYCYTTEKPSRN